MTQKTLLTSDFDAVTAAQAVTGPETGEPDDELTQLECLKQSDLELIARQLRSRVIEVSHRTRTAHLGSCLSCVDILVALYFRYLRIDARQPDAAERDRFILSKGHAASALYAVLSVRGFFRDDLLDTHGEAGSILEEHPNPRYIPGVEAATGSLGHGLPLACGMALASRIQGPSYRVCALMSDGECNEGSVWEAAMFAAAQKLDQLTVIIDFNKWQATGRSCDILALQSLKDKWLAFGWDAKEIDGHDIEALAQAVNGASNAKPRVFIAHTVKGKGVSFMEDDNNWHYRIPTADEVLAAKKELGLV